MRIILSLLLAFFALTGSAQIRGNEITVTVTLDHKDWTYTTGEKVNFTISVLRSGTLVDNAEISYELGPEMYPTEKKDLTLKTGQTVVSGKMKQPGFLRLKAMAHVDGKDYSGMCTAAVSPEQLKPYAEKPADFEEFWGKALEEARWTSLEPTFEFLPERSTPKVNTYHVSFQNDRWGRRVYAILNVPTVPGKYPALLRVPGAGVRPYGGDQWTAAKGVIVVEIGIHGIPVNKEQAYYDQLFTAALADYWQHSLNDRNKNYYKHVVTGAVRAVDFIAALGHEANPMGSPSTGAQDKLGVEWDGKNLGVTGSSQGGFLSLAVAALDKRVSCYGAVHAAMCDHEASLHKVACGWPHYWYNVDNPDPREVAEGRYYDGVNFACCITCPGWFSFGYNDDVVPPTTAWATYNTVTAPKEIRPYQLTGHFWFQEQWDTWQAWLLSHLGVKQ